MVFQEPADVRGTAYLAWDYEDAGREDDKWLYIPSIRKARRISGASRNEYFMGTDFTYDDMGRRAVDEDTHTLLGEETVLEHPCWKIESVPVNKDDLYTRKVFWVSQRAHLVMQGEYYDRDGLIKTYKALDVRSIRECPASRRAKPRLRAMLVLPGPSSSPSSWADSS